MITKLINLAEKGLLPDFIVRYGIRTLLTKRLKSLIHTDQHTNKNNKIIVSKNLLELKKKKRRIRG